MTSFEIKAALAGKGVKQKTIAEMSGRSKQLVSDVIAGYRRSDEVEIAIAAVIGVPVGEVFPVQKSMAAAPAA